MAEEWEPPAGLVSEGLIDELREMLVKPSRRGSGRASAGRPVSQSGMPASASPRKRAPPSNVSEASGAGQGPGAAEQEPQESWESRESHEALQKDSRGASPERGRPQSSPLRDGASAGQDSPFASPSSGRAKGRGGQAGERKARFMDLTSFLNRARTAAPAASAQRGQREMPAHQEGTSDAVSVSSHLQDSSHATELSESASSGTSDALAGLGESRATGAADEVVVLGDGTPCSPSADGSGPRPQEKTVEIFDFSEFPDPPGAPGSSGSLQTPGLPDPPRPHDRATSLQRFLGLTRVPATDAQRGTTAADTASPRNLEPAAASTTADATASVPMASKPAKMSRLKLGVKKAPAASQDPSNPFYRRQLTDLTCDLLQHPIYVSPEEVDAFVARIDSRPAAELPDFSLGSLSTADGSSAGAASSDKLGVSTSLSRRQLRAYARTLGDKLRQPHAALQKALLAQGIDQRAALKARRTLVGVFETPATMRHAVKKVAGLLDEQKGILADGGFVIRAEGEEEKEEQALDTTTQQFYRHRAREIFRLISKLEAAAESPRISVREEAGFSKCVASVHMPQRVFFGLCPTQCRELSALAPLAVEEDVDYDCITCGFDVDEDTETEGDSEESDEENGPDAELEGLGALETKRLLGVEGGPDTVELDGEGETTPADTLRYLKIRALILGSGRPQASGERDDIGGDAREQAHLYSVPRGYLDMLAANPDVAAAAAGSAQVQAAVSRRLGLSKSAAGVSGTSGAIESPKEGKAAGRKAPPTGARAGAGAAAAAATTTTATTSSPPASSRPSGSAGTGNQSGQGNQNGQGDAADQDGDSEPDIDTWNYKAKFAREKALLDSLRKMQGLFVYPVPIFCPEVATWEKSEFLVPVVTAGGSQRAGGPGGVSSGGSADAHAANAAAAGKPAQHLNQYDVLVSHDALAVQHLEPVFVRRSAPPEENVIFRDLPRDPCGMDIQESSEEED